MKWTALLMAACGAPAPPHNVAPAHDVELAIASEREVRVYRAADRLRLERTVTLPSPVAALAWAGDRLVVQLADGGIGWVTDHYEPLPALPASTWDLPEPAGGSKVDDWSVIVTATGEVWQAHAAWVVPTETAQVAQVVYARRVPSLDVTRTAPSPIPPPPLAHVEAPASPRVQRVGVDRVQCGDDTFPSDAHYLELQRISQITWLAATPPIYELQLDYVTQVDPIYAYTRFAYFESCMRSPVDSVLPGPGTYTALLGDNQLRLVHDGKVIDTVAGGYAAFRY